MSAQALAPVAPARARREAIPANAVRAVPGSARRPSRNAASARGSFSIRRSRW